MSGQYVCVSSLHLPCSGERMIEIYKISSPDGSAYVGQTSVGVANRVARHRHSPCNQRLYNKLLTMEPVIEVLSRHRKPEIADRQERRQILLLLNPINTYAPGAPVRKNPTVENLGNNRRHPKRNRRKYPRKASDHHVCSWCWRKLPVAKFHTDRNRSAGR